MRTTPRFVIEQHEKTYAADTWVKIDGYDDKTMAMEEARSCRRILARIGPSTKIRVRDTQSPIEVGDEWYDDNLPCVNVRVGEVRFSLWWTSISTIADLKWANDVKKARTNVQGLFDVVMALGQEGIEQDRDESVMDPDNDPRFTDWGTIGKEEVGR